MALSRTVVGTVEANTASTATISSAALATGDLLVCTVSAGVYPNANEVTGVTWNGNAMTLAVEQVGVNDGADQSTWVHASIWYYKVTSGATGDIVATAGGTNSSIHMAAVKYTGHDATTPIGDTDAIYKNNTQTPDPTLTLTTVSGDEVVDCCSAYLEFGATISLGAGQTSIYEDKDTAGFFGIGASVEAASGTSVTMSWSRNGTQAYCYCAAVIQAAAGAAEKTPYNPQPLRGPLLAQ